MIVPDSPPRPALEDDILSETRQRKEAYAEEYGHDLSAIAGAANAHARDDGLALEHRVVRAPSDDAEA